MADRPRWSAAVPGRSRAAGGREPLRFALAYRARALESTPVGGAVYST